MAEDKSSIFTSEAPADLIKGWNEKRQSNNTVISGLTPFVQLIGLFNLEDYRKMLSADEWLDKRQVYYVEDGEETEKMTIQAYEKNGPTFISLKNDPTLSKSITGTK